MSTLHSNISSCVNSTSTTALSSSAVSKSSSEIFIQSMNGQSCLITYCAILLLIFTNNHKIKFEAKYLVHGMIYFDTIAFIIANINLGKNTNQQIQIQIKI